MSGKPHIEANWTGRSPCLCQGEWTLAIDGKDYSAAIPEDRRTRHMDTYGEWRLAGIDGERWYEDGLKPDEWIKENAGWASALPIGPNELLELYAAFHAEDFRPGSCGGRV